MLVLSVKQVAANPSRRSLATPASILWVDAGRALGDDQAAELQLVRRELESLAALKARVRDPRVRLHPRPSHDQDLSHSAINLEHAAAGSGVLVAGVGGGVGVGAEALRQYSGQVSALVETQVGAAWL